MIYLDNASTTQYKPPAVIDAVTDCLTKYPFNPNRGGSISLTLSQKIAETRKKISFLCNNDGENHVVFTGGCTQALNLAILGRARRGHVIISATEHNAVIRPVMQLCKRAYTEVSIVNPDATGQITVESLQNALRKDTYMLCVSATSNVTGTSQKLKDLGLFARQNGLIFLVDCAQSMGYYPVDMQKYNVDMVAFPSHKGLHGMQGAGALVFNKRAIPKPIVFGGTGAESHLLYQPATLPDSLESGTSPNPAILSMSAGIDWWINNHQKHGKIIENCAHTIINGLKAIPNVTVYSQPNKSGIVAFNVGKMDSGFVCDYMAEKHDIHMRGGLHCAPTMHKYLGTFEQGVVRASVSCMTTKEHCFALLNAVDALARYRQ